MALCYITASAARIGHSALGTSNNKCLSVSLSFFEQRICFYNVEDAHPDIPGAKKMGGRARHIAMN